MGSVFEIITELRRTVANATGPYLPSIRSLAHSYKCDIHTVSQALHALRNEGLVQFRRGQRIRIADRIATASPNAPGAAWVSASDRLANEVRNMIVSGEFRAGDLLPKVGYFVQTWAISTSTVRKALLSLAQQGMIHRRGRSWVIGREISQLRTASLDRLPIILLVQPQRHSWEGLMTGMAARFVSMFKSEVERRNFRLLASSAEKFGPGPALPYEDTKAAMNMVAGQAMYTGALVIGRPEEYRDFGKVLGGLAALGKPFVWLDRRNEGASMDRYKRMYRCTFSADAFTYEAIEFLKSMGHSCAGYAGALDNSWQEVRGQSLAEFCSRQSIELLRYHDLVSGFKQMDIDELSLHLRDLTRHESPMTSTTVNYLLRSLQKQSGGDENNIVALARILKKYPDLPDGSIVSGARVAALTDLLFPKENYLSFDHLQNLLPFLLSPRITAIISPRDRSTPNALGKLTEIGIRVPDDISLISYDNQLQLAFLPVTTVDNGAEDLGYQAFHAIVGDVPLRADRTGLILAKPSVVRRGSVKRLF